MKRAVESDEDSASHNMGGFLERLVGWKFSSNGPAKFTKNYVHRSAGITTIRQTLWAGSDSLKESVRAVENEVGVNIARKVSIA